MCEYLEELTVLNKFYKLFNKKYFGETLPQCIVTIQSSVKTNGHFTCGKVWKTGNTEKYEINISAENLKRGIHKTCGTLIHEMVHCYAQVNNIKDTSRGGRYHNEKFRKKATECGLNIDYAESIGWSVTTPTQSLIDFIDSQKITAPNLFRITIIKEKKASKQSRRNYICPSCDLKITAYKDDINIKCIDCDMQMIQEKQET
jgi:hypothetical protein